MKKIITTIFSLLFLGLIQTFALPGFTTEIPDENGQFVYYRDYSFERESYIGLLKFDEKSYEIRYYSPANKKNENEINIELLFSINPEKNYLDITGELIASEISYTQEEIDILNYLHDILYEFSSRRIKMGKINPDDKNYILNKDLSENGINSSEFYEQFGGQVTINYDLVIPFYNIKNIKDSNGKILLECITLGKITDNSDLTFKKFNPPFKDKFSRKASKIKSKKNKEVNFDFISFKLDENWEENVDFPSNYNIQDENIFSCIFNFNTDPFSDSNIELIWKIRGNFISHNEFYYILPQSKCQYDEKNKKLSLQIHTIGNNTYYTEQFVIFINSKDNDNSILFLLNTYSAIYEKNKNYFDDIIKSIKTTY